MGKTGRIRRPQQQSGQRIKTPDQRQPTADHLPPHFSFEHCHPKYSVEQCEQVEAAALARTLVKLSQLTWREILTTQRNGLGTHMIAVNAIRAPKPPIVTADMTLYSIRFFKKVPIVGFRDGRVFHIVWIDRGFNVYSHGS